MSFTAKSKIKRDATESFSEIVSLADNTVVQLTFEGETELTITSVDKTGNITKLAQRLTVPEIPREIASDNSKNTNGDQEVDDSGSGSGGGGFDLFSAPLLLMLWIFRLGISMHERRSSRRESA